MVFDIKGLLLGGKGAFADGFAEAGRHDDGELHLATAALLVEAACMDGTFDAEERGAIATLLETRFELDGADVEALIDDGRKAVETSQLYAFTRIVKDRFSEEERVHMIEMLWEVAYADGILHDYEANLVRRVAGLIYVTDRDSGEARKRALNRLESTATPTP